MELGSILKTLQSAIARKQASKETEAQRTLRAKEEQIQRQLAEFAQQQKEEQYVPPSPKTAHGLTVLRLCQRGHIDRVPGTHWQAGGCANSGAEEAEASV